MYAPTYPFAQGGGAGDSNAQQSGYNPNALSAPPSAQQHLAQPPQHMMYNPQQYGPGAHQSPYGGGMGVNPGIMQNNNGMAHMPANNGLGMLHRVLVIDKLSCHLPLHFLRAVSRPASSGVEHLWGSSGRVDGKIRHERSLVRESS